METKKEVIKIFNQMKSFTNMLCELTNMVLKEITQSEKCEELPFFLFFVADTCYVMYDREKEMIVSINLRMINNMGIMVEIDPINYTITGLIAGEKVDSIKMEEDVAEMLYACIQKCWNLQMCAGCLRTVEEDDQFLAADLFR